MDPVGSSVHARGVGRARELATVAFARDSARTGHGSVVVVTGGAGIGKTWLCAAAAETARHEGFTTAWGAGWPTGSAPALWPWRQALGELEAHEAVAVLDSFPAGPDDPSWFLRGAELVEALRTATAARPAMVVIDDLQTADLASTQLAWFLARHARRLHLLVLVAHRDQDDGPAPSSATIEALDGLGRDGTGLALAGLAAEEVAAILRHDGRVELPAVDLAFILQATGGRPAEIGRAAAAAADAPDPRAAALDAVVAPRLAALAPAVRRAAARAALVARSVTWAELAAVADLDDPAPAVVSAALQHQHLAVAVGPNELAFGHEHVMAALTSSLTPGEAAEAHARAATHLAAGPARAIERRARQAHHALSSAARSADAARSAVTAARDASASLAAANQHDRAADLLGRAVAVHESEGLGEPPAALLAARATAVLRGGRLAESRVLFDEAAATAGREDDITSLAVAALGLGGIWLSEHRSTLDSQRIVGLQRLALRRLPDHEEVLRGRLRVRLAAEAAYASGPDGHLSEALADALADARELGDPVVLAEALSLYHHLLLGPDDAIERLAVAREIISAATDGGDALLQLVGLCWLTVDQFLAGDRQAERSLRELHAGAAAIGCRSIGFVAAVMDVMLLMRAGRLDDAEQRAAACFELGTEVGDADALAWYGVQIVVIRWLQGREREVLDLAADTATSPTLFRANNAFVAVVAHLAAECGEIDRAEAALARLRADGLEQIRHSSVWLAMLSSAIDAASIVGDAALLAELGALLEPFAGLPMLGSMAVVCLGSTHRALGLVALGASDPERAVTELELAVADNDRLGNRPLAAMARADLARALVERSRPGDRDQAIVLLDRAGREATAMGLSTRADLWRTRRATVDPEAGGPPPGPVAGTRAEPASSSRSGPALEAGTGVIRRRGASWILTTAATEVIIADLLGMAYLAELLLRPGREIATVDLAGVVGHEALWNREQPVLDQQALDAYRSRITTLEEELDEADRWADSERAARAQAELDELVVELARSTGLHGRPRSFDSQAERARTAVRKAIRRALDHIEAEDAALGAALRRSIQTGRACCYRPGPGAPARWIED